MSIEQSHGKARPTLPRSSDLPVTEEPTDRSEGRTADGRFAPVHGLSFSKGWDNYFAEVLGRDAEGGVGELGRKAWKLYRGFLSELPCVNVSVRSLCTQRARAATMADFYAQLGTRSGPHTEKGMAWLAEALKWDQRAERLGVTATDLSLRAAKAPNRRRVIDAHAEVERAFGEPSGSEP